jgi:hypothetical protein
MAWSAGITGPLPPAVGSNRPELAGPHCTQLGVAGSSKSPEAAGTLQPEEEVGSTLLAVVV